MRGFNMCHVRALILISIFCELTLGEAPLTKPVFTKKMQMALYYKPTGSSLSLRCPADGNPTPTIAWLKDKQPLGRRMGEEIRYKKWSLNMEDLVKSDSGQYTCIVSNALGSINWTYTVELNERINHRPIIQDGYPVNVTVPLGGQALFECRFISDLQAHVRWLKRIAGQPHITEVTSLNVSIKGPNFLVIDNVTHGDEGWYTCLAENSLGYNYKDVYLSILTVKPVFTKKMKIALYSKPTGSSLSLRCPADGNPTPTIAWLKDKQPLGRRMGEKIQYRKWSLYMENLVKSDSGQYTCTVSNTVGSINWTYTVRVIERINHRPIFLDGYPVNVTVPLGGQAHFECRFISDLQPHVRWLKLIAINGSYNDSAGQPYITEVTSRNVSIKDPHLLVIDNVTHEDEGWYTCLVGNTMGYNHKEVYLSILTVKPIFTHPKKMQISFHAKLAGQSLILKCPADGNPTPTIAWLKDKQPLGRRVEKEIQYKKWSLFIEKLVKSDSGQYTCIVSNALGSINWTYTVEVQERINHRPIFQDGYPVNVTVPLGGQAHFECRFISDLQPNVRWLKRIAINGSYNDSAGQPHIIEVTSRNVTIKDPQLLVIDNVTYEDEGWYTCVAGNSMGYSHKDVYLSILTDSSLKGSPV